MPGAAEGAASLETVAGFPIQPMRGFNHSGNGRDR